MSESNNDESCRIGAVISKNKADKFKKIANIRHRFQHGAIKRSLIDAIDIYVLIIKTYFKHRDDITRILETEYGHLNNDKDRFLKMLEDALNEFISNKRNKLSAIVTFTPLIYYLIMGYDIFLVIGCLLFI